MLSLINFIVSEVQRKNIATQGDLDKYNKSIDALEDKPWIDVALGVIFAIGGIIALCFGLPPVGLPLFIVGIVMITTALVFLKSQTAIERLAKNVNTLWNLKLENQGV